MFFRFFFGFFFHSFVISFTRRFDAFGSFHFPFLFYSLGFISLFAHPGSPPWFRTPRNRFSFLVVGLPSDRKPCEPPISSCQAPWQDSVATTKIKDLEAVLTLEEEGA